jgi:hypothetical protein
VALQRYTAGVTDTITMLLQAGRHLKFVGKDVLAKAVRVAAAGSFLGWSVRQRALGHSRAGPTSRTASKERM